MRGSIRKMAVVAFLATAPLAATLLTPPEAEASHCYRCVWQWPGPFQCRTGGAEGQTANCTANYSGCTLWGFCVD
jgi:hypothetical protein